MKTLAFIALIGSTALALSACHTVKGVGEDVEVTGHAIEHAAKTRPGCCCPHCTYYPQHIKRRNKER